MTSVLQQLHLKPVVGPNEHDHNIPALCGQADPGTLFYASAEDRAKFEKLQSEHGPGASYEMCPGCAEAWLSGN